MKLLSDDELMELMEKNGKIVLENEEKFALLLKEIERRLFKK